MSAAPSPEQFLAECHKRGIRLHVQGEAIKATGKPPARPEAFVAFLKAKKPELLRLLLPRDHCAISSHGGHLAVGAPGMPQNDPSLDYPPAAEEVRKSAIKADSEVLPGESTAPLDAIPAGALYPDDRQAMIDWAMIHVKAGTLPVPSIPIFLPSGKRIEEEMASRFLLEGHERALRLCSIESQSAHEAFLLLRQDLRHVASWCAKEWHVLKRIEDSVSPHLDHLSELWEAAMKMAKERSFMPAGVEVMV